MRVGILGGTGAEGRGLALRWSRGGVEVVIGSRSAEKAERVAGEVNERLGTGTVTGAENREAARRGDIVVSTLPHDSHIETIRSLSDELRGKLLMTATVIWPPAPREKPSAAEQLRDALGEDVRVVAAFQTVGAGALADLDHEPDEDVLVCGDTDEARREAIEAIRLTGLRALAVGKLEQSRTVEAMTGLLIRTNKIHRVKAAGIRITGLPEE